MDDVFATQVGLPHQQLAVRAFDAGEHLDRLVGQAVRVGGLRADGAVREHVGLLGGERIRVADSSRIEGPDDRSPRRAVGALPQGEPERFLTRELAAHELVERGECGRVAVEQGGSDGGFHGQLHVVFDGAGDLGDLVVAELGADDERAGDGHHGDHGEADQPHDDDQPPERGSGSRRPEVDELVVVPLGVGSLGLPGPKHLPIVPCCGPY